MKKYLQKLYPAIILFSLALFISGCGIWSDFTSYFNLYYNTKDKFEEAENAIKLQRKYFFQFEEPNISGNVPQLLTQVVEKASKLLQFHSSSSYVDNALLMLGKSFYYQKNYLKALRKFQELIVTDPESDLILENDLWIGKTQMRLKNHRDALELLKSVRERAIEESEDEILSEAYAEEIVHLILEEKFPLAISLMNEFLENSDNDELNAEVVYELAKLYMKTNELDNAIASYEKVFEYSPTFEIELNSKIELAKALREVKKNEDALVILESMREQNKYSDSFDKIDLELGITLYSLGRVDEAVETLVKVDTIYVTTTSSGIAKFKLGEIFEYHFRNFDSASTYYVKSASSTAPPEYSKPASEKALLFRKYQTIQKNISDAKKQLVYVENPEEFVKDSIEFYSDTLTTEETEVQQVPGGEKGFEGDEKGLIPPQKTPVRTDNRTPPVRPLLSADSLKAIILKNEFDLANLFFTEINVPDSAYHLYKNIVDNHPESPHYLQSFYSLGAYYKTVGRAEEADSIFNFIYENYRTESIVNAAANQLKKPLINLNYDPADELYVGAEKKMIEKKFSESISAFYNIFLNYPKSSFAPKALYAGGWILENEFKLFDSAAVYFDSISVLYPQSQYASSVRAKLSFYKEENQRKKKAIEDSLKQIELKKTAETKTDSLQQTLTPDEEKKGEQTELEEEKNLEDKLPEELDEDVKRKKLEIDERKEPEEFNDSTNTETKIPIKR